MKHRLGVLLVLFTCGCSIVDPGDRDELRDRIAMMSPDDIPFAKRWTMNTKAVDWLRRRPPGDQMGKLQCRYQAGGQWSNWADQEPTYIVLDMLECLLKRPFAVTYILCKEEWEALESQIRRTDLLNSLPVPGGASVECRFVWDFRYEPEKAPIKVTDPDAVTPDDMIDAMIGLPAPPPGWMFPQLIPLLCPLGAGPGWGCPPRPTDPTGGEPTDPTGGEPGDRP
ncbi:hypothetical protein [Sorangium sp. So ce362]|uniref:hypothetical protein n=1 Tax=Sorangium sp. So ce362 TaxID=3133303 RepID=UPI003F61E580